MLIKSAEITKFKCVDYSGRIDIEDNVTCFVGKNESGKTATLEAIYRLNPIPSGHKTEFNGSLEYPRRLRSRESSRILATMPIKAIFVLENEDVSVIESEYGIGSLKSTEIEVSKDYENQYHISVVIDEAKVIDFLLSQQGIEKEVTQGKSTIAELKSVLTAMEKRPEAVEGLLKHLNDLDVQRNIEEKLLELLPEFLYFDDYSRMPGRFSIPYIQKAPEQNLESGERTALSLLRLAGVATEEFVQNNYEERKAALEAASVELSQEVFEYWSQNQDLRVEIDADFNSPANGDRVPPFLETRIWNNRHFMSLNFNERSAGFVWFFSFLAFFSEYRYSTKRLVILLDEPGLGLHASAQADLLRFIDEKLAEKHQIIYTTHSPFMVKPTDLDRARTVEDVIGEGTKISSEVLTTTKDTVFPLQAAIGYELSQTLFVGPNNLVVEGPSDILYLQIISQHLVSQGRQGLDDKWVIVPVGGSEKIPTFLALLGTQLNVAVLLDVSSSGNQKVDDLVNRGILETGKIFPLNKFTGLKEADIEDMFVPSFYLQLLKGSEVGNFKVGDLQQGARIVQRIEKTLGHTYNHYAPSAYFLHEQATLLSRVADSTLDRFETLFVDINNALQ